MIRNFNYNTLIKGVASFFFIALFSFSNNTFAQSGEEIFEGYCTSCHSIGGGTVVGPDLDGITDRRSEEWLVKWIQNSPALIASGDKEAVEVSAFSPSVMPPQPLDADQVKTLLSYIEAYEPPVEVASAGDTSEVIEEDSDFSIYLILAAIIGFFLMVITLLDPIRRQIEANKLGGDVQDLSLVEKIQDWVCKNTKFIIIIIIVLVCLGAWDTWYTLKDVGVYQGYHPEQPIKFSHKIHAGTNDIDCQYCHSGASKSKHSGVPSANVCMNCHKYISKGSETGETEIAKIYEAVGFDAKTKQYIEDAEQKPIEWIKVHNLPDHVYFNHSQHVTVGKIECQTCHGDVKEMGTVEQAEPLTMGWCVNCHRETGVQNSGEYYEDIHNRLTDEQKAKFAEDGKLTVSELGGIECGKCHY